MGYQFWEPIPRSSSDPTRLVPYIAAQVAVEHDLNDLADVNVPAPADTEVLTYDTGTSKWIAAAAGGAGDLNWVRHLKIGWYHWGVFAFPGHDDTETVNANRLFAMPFWIPIQMTFDRIGIQVTTGAAGDARLGIYEDDTTYPGDLAIDAGIVDVTGVGLKEIVINKTLAAGLYWVVILAEVEIAVRASNRHFLSIIGCVSGSYLPNASHHQAQAYGALPDPFPAAGSYAQGYRMIRMRRSA